MILNLALGHQEGVTRAYGRRVEVSGGEAEWLLVLPKDTVITDAQAKALVGEFAGAVVACAMFVPPKPESEVPVAAELPSPPVPA